MRVLVVEDDGETAEYICTSLKALGHVTKHASDGKQGFLGVLLEPSGYGGIPGRQFHCDGSHSIRER